MIDKNKMEKVFASNNKQAIIGSIMEMVFNAEKSEVSWISEKLVELSKDQDTDISGLALTCFGHLARLYSSVGNYDKVIALLHSKQNIPELQGRAEDALEDISLFLSNY